MRVGRPAARRAGDRNRKQRQPDQPDDREREAGNAGGGDRQVQVAVVRVGGGGCPGVLLAQPEYDPFGAPEGAEAKARDRTTGKFAEREFPMSLRPVKDGSDIVACRIA